MGIPAFASVLDIKAKVDLAVIVVPAPAVPKVLQECINKGIKGAVIITAGFMETGHEGAVLQQKIVSIAREGNLRFVGPNGIASSALNPSQSLLLSLAKKGTYAFVSQSGTYGQSCQAAVAKGYGLSKFISIGNQADLTASDYLEYLAEDPDTHVIVFYMEGFKDGNRFFRMAREIVKNKPILIYKGGRSEVGSRATRSHTGSLAGQDHIFDAMCRQAGIIRAEEIMQPFDEARPLYQCHCQREEKLESWEWRPKACYI
jgi:acyl-CoA synthetase (NDP forming)